MYKHRSFYLPLTDLTVGAVEASGTGAGVGPDACASVHTQRVTESCGTDRSVPDNFISVMFYFSYLWEKHLIKRITVQCFVPEAHVGPYQPGLHLQTSGETHSPPFSQCLLHTTVDTRKWIQSLQIGKALNWYYDLFWGKYCAVKFSPLNLTFDS